MLSKYKFIISPEGNGIDCHRHYEAILCGCIPIIEYNKDIEKNMKVSLFFIQKIIQK